MKENETVMIRASHLAKEYRLGQINSGTLTSDLQSWWAKKQHKEDPNCPIGLPSKKSNRFLALDDVSFDIYKSDKIGIIGSNGAGKSTLLKVLSRITAPSGGKFAYNGKIASMLEVGTGFNPEMTGRENTYLNGAILGMTRSEVAQKMDRIIEFSECGQFIDTPVKRYSSGMYVKLAFSVAAHLDADILIMDEVLAVGDVNFQQKCLQKMKDLAAEDGRTVLYVSHNMSTIRQLCNRCFVLSKGKLIFQGDTETAIQVYLNEGYSNSCLYALQDAPRWSLPMGAKLHSFEFVDKEISYFERGEPICAKVVWEALDDVHNVTLRWDIKNGGISVVGITTGDLGNARKGQLVESLVRFDASSLMDGRYSFTMSLRQSSLFIPTEPMDDLKTIFYFEIGNQDPNAPHWNHNDFGHFQLNPIQAQTRVLSQDAQREESPCDP